MTLGLTPPRAAACLIAAAFSWASAAQADPLPRFALPVDCTLGQDCFLQQYVDHDPGPGTRELTCGDQTYDGHKGTDFALATEADLARHVGVLAIAPGRVTAARSDMKDATYDRDAPEALGGRDCGNGLILEHEGGWTSQYCHMAEGSITLAPGDMVTTGTPLGRIGLSGRTEFPHLHLTLRHEGRVVDPFAPDGVTGCDTPPEATLWAPDISATTGGVMDLGFAPLVPEYDAIRAGTAPREVTAEAPALVLWAFAHGGRQGDVIELEITGPQGQIIRHRALLKTSQARLFRAAGKKRKTDRWPPGAYLGRATLWRGDQMISQRDTRFTLP
ncbi:M23 family metallopeptidase [Roseovarius nubinhibens]|uniref:Peptidase, M23/M37 family protein n=1 Tax=Roseovarius nubinhibens (strain ATCC BAA-591 / DSM 15170 / ISM) TaxID=89187 RepID=A3SRM6_ROSNI|nr:M23 family metallopeptidase [Roseovarius nubinhibens]EAP75249.1 peptidase, M23/M37 family protein [Roseovarius nubinhibens ISM]